MIGKVILRGGIEVVMQDSGEWTCERDSIYADRFNGSYPPDVGLSSLPFGRHAVSIAAAQEGGKAVFERPLPPLPSGMIS